MHRFRGTCRKKLIGLIALLAVAFAVGSPARAQVSLYAEASANSMNNGPYADFLYSGTTGVVIGLGEFWHDRVVLSGDVQGNFGFNNSHPSFPTFASNETYNAVTLGPRIGLKPQFFKLAPYIQGNIGFARYHDPITHSSTDAVFGGQAGVARQLTPRFDAVVDYSYSYFAYNSGYYHPQTFGIGIAYHFARR